jgi:3,4-dihydroxy 2-butanone 4-phosphate synthase/GTP cyclohydrolase II
LSFEKILELDKEEHASCSFDWNCENCFKSLCLRLLGVADFPSMYGDFKILSFLNNKDGKDHIAVIKGDVIGKEDVLTRIHSACLTGDALGSMRCDCGPQLRLSLKEIQENGEGVFLYMQQEGRGIGLANKIKAYMLQDEGLDTYDANIHLGFEPDERDFELSAAMMKKLDVKSIRLMTNNPTKLKDLEKFGVIVKERVSIEIPPTEFDLKYLETKKTRFGHLLTLEKDQKKKK